MLSANASEVLTVMAIVIIGLIFFNQIFQPILAIQLLYINLVTDTFPVLALGVSYKVILKFKPHIIITAPLNLYSNFKPVGGHHLSHFGNVLVKIVQTEREVEYSLIQHPFLPERSLTKRISQKSKKGLTRPSKNTTFDS